MYAAPARGHRTLTCARSGVIVSIVYRTYVSLGKPGRGGAPFFSPFLQVRWFSGARGCCLVAWLVAWLLACLRGAASPPLESNAAGRCLSCFGRVNGGTRRKRKRKRKRLGLGLGQDRGVKIGDSAGGSLTLGLTRATVGGFLFRPAFYGLGCRCLLYSTRNFVS